MLDVLKDQPYVTSDTLIIVEAALHTDFSWTRDMGFLVEREKVYKTNKHVMIRRAADGQSFAEI